MQCLELLHVAGNGAGMVCAEQVPAEGGWCNNEGEHLAAIAHCLERDEFSV